VAKRVDKLLASGGLRMTAAIEAERRRELEAAFTELARAAAAERARLEAALEKIADPLADWHVVEIAEARVRDVVLDLGQRRFTVYRPEQIVRKRCRGRLVPVPAPFFPGYLFVRFRVCAEWSSLLGVRGIRDVLMVGEAPATVPEAAMAAIVELERRLDLRNRVRRRLAAFPFDVAQRVRVVDGAFAELVGMIERLDARGRITVLLDGVMGRAVRVDLDPAQIAAA
jgi:transcriptional antiterminator RfaH